MKRRILSMILSLTMVGSLLCGCGGTKEEGPVTITIWHDKEDDVAATLEEALAVLEPDIHVVLEKKEGLTDALKMVGNDPNSAPDMYFFAHDKIGVYAQMGILAPITDFVSQEKLNEYLPVTLDAATYNGQIYQLPIYYESLLFMYNKAYMSDDAVPATTEELYQYMAENTKDGRYGFVEQHSTAYYSIPWIHGFGGELIDDDNNPALISKEVKDALNYHCKFLEYMPNESEYSTVNTLFLEGQADSIIGGPWLVPTAREAGIDLGFAKMPVVDSTGKELAPYTGVQGVHVLKVAEETKKDEITRVLEVLSNPELGIKMAQKSGCAPANTLCYEDETVKNDPMVQTMKEIADSAVAMPNVPQMDVMFVVAGNMLVAINMNGEDVDSATQDSQGKAEKLIEAMK